MVDKRPAWKQVHNEHLAVGWQVEPIHNALKYLGSAWNPSLRHLKLKLETLQRIKRLADRDLVACHCLQ